MESNREEIERYMTLATKALQHNEYEKSISILQGILEKNPGYMPAYAYTGHILMHTDTPKKALPYLDKALELASEEAQNWIILGNYYKRLKVWSEAIRAYQKSLELSGDNATTLYELFKIYRELSSHSGATTTIQKLLLIDPGNSTYQWEYAKLLQDMEKEEEALAAYDQLVNSATGSIPMEVIEKWYHLMLKYHFTKEARSRLKSLSQENPNSMKIKELYGLACEADMDDRTAFKIFWDIYKQTPENIKIVYMVGALSYRLGDIENAEKFLKLVLDKDPLYVPALYTLSDMHRYEIDDDIFRKLKYAKDNILDLSIDHRAQLYFALGRAYDDINDIEIAFEYYKKGGELYSQGKGETDYATLYPHVAQIKNLLTKSFFENNTEDGCRIKKPIFIIGMPRSGTTLIEQVLSSIKGVYGAGETEYIPDVLNQMDMGAFILEFGRQKSLFPQQKEASYLDRGSIYIKMLESLSDKETKFIIDKTPMNFIWLGYIHLILPQATIIHAQRHPVETCLSIYRLFFPNTLYWSYNLKSVGKIYRLYHELMQHWKSVLPENSILDVRYEDMVNDLETESKRLTDHIGLPWDNSCLEFHKSQRAVRTASVFQVRQPIYKTSMNRWKKYESYLQPLLDEIGDLSMEYEKKLNINNCTRVDLST